MIKPESSSESEKKQKMCACGTSKNDWQRIPRGFFLKTFLFWLPVKHYKCHRCGRRHWVIN